MRIFLTVSALAIALAGCSRSADDTPAQTADHEVTDLSHVRAPGEAEAAAKALPAGNFSEFTLGGHVGASEKAEGSTAAMTNAVGPIADLRGFVACPQDMKVCDPRTAPAGTVYTYVMVVYPGGDNKQRPGETHYSDVERATAFRLTMPASGFTGVAGYSKPEALAAIGAKADVVVTCDAGKLVWTVSAGDGGNQWGAKEPITFYWQSTLPPSGKARAYALDADGTTATGEAWYPAAKEGAKNACS